jgi:hypothetical protein
VSGIGVARGEGLWRDAALLVLVFGSLLLYLFTATPEFFSESQGGDYPYYVQIAQAPFDNAVPSPWRYRLLNPLLAALLQSVGISTDAAFLTLTCVFAFVSCVLMRVYLRQIGASPFAACAGMLLFAVSVGGFVPMRRYYGYTDALTNAFTLLILASAAAERYGVTVAALAVGTVAKESTLLLLPFLVVSLWIARARRVVLAALVLVPLLVFGALRWLVTPDGTGFAPVALTWEAQTEYWRAAMVHGVGRWVLWSFAYSLGPVWLLSAIGARRQWQFLTAQLLLLLPIVVPLLRTTDTERALMLAFPVAYPLAAFALDRWRDSRYRALVATCAMVCTWIAQLTFDWTQPMHFGPVNAKDLLFVSLCVLPLVPWVISESRARTA